MHVFMGFFGFRGGDFRLERVGTRLVTKSVLAANAVPIRVTTNCGTRATGRILLQALSAWSFAQGQCERPSATSLPASARDDPADDQRQRQQPSTQDAEQAEAVAVVLEEAALGRPPDGCPVGCFS